MDKALRSSLYRTVVDCRRLLERDVTRQLEGVYGIHIDGTIEKLDRLTNLDAVGRADRRAIEAAIQHEESMGVGHDEAVDRFIRETAFTTLNRLVALKLMEHPSRGIIPQTVGAKAQSKGFQQFSLVSPEAMRGQPDRGYRLYLELMLDDLSHGLGVLFDRTLPTSIIFPTVATFSEVLDNLNDLALEAAWAQDETIGWVYQYFTPGELREQARKESSAPRNSYELAFRNQFYTPRYVVAFLTENTLGRLWWEMRGGDTALVEQCRYLITHTESNTSQPKRDPRTWRILDPACGSGHFLLYCFDLLQVIYQEAYYDPDLGSALQADYPDYEDFRREVPRLIIEHNLHGIDIDPRAAQIAWLALWLRAQRTYKDLGIKKVVERPRIVAPLIACAEPMPGEYDLLGEFCRELNFGPLEKMLREIWQKMELAGEVGSLLKIEQEIRVSISSTRQLLEGFKEAGVQMHLFGPEPPRQLELNLKASDLDDTNFWEQAEERVLEALRRYASRTRQNGQVTRRLFVDDAIQGIAFIDHFQRPFDVVLMNPPFGAASVGSKDYINAAYPRTKNDLYAAFVERGLEVLRPGGYLGAISSRTGFFLTSFQKWREEILLKEAHLITMADLGYGVLDTAMVETAAYTLQKGAESCA